MGMSSERAAHWDRIFSERADHELSWFEPDPRISLELVMSVCPDTTASIIDIGGGTSLLTDRLSDAGYVDLTVLDVSDEAIARDRARFADRAERVRWIRADVTEVEDLGAFSVWHDRAAFHFLTQRTDREVYVDLMRRTVAIGGHAIIATFAPDAPTHCSGLRVRGYDAGALAEQVGDGFALEHEHLRRELHVTPSGVRQPFVYAVFSRTS